MTFATTSNGAHLVVRRESGMVVPSCGGLVQGTAGLWLTRVSKAGRLGVCEGFAGRRRLVRSYLPY